MKIMEYRPIEVKLIRGKDLKDVNVISRMDVYVIGSVSADPRSMQRTAVDKDGGVNPKWNHVMRFNVDESAARLNRLGLVFQIMSDRTLGDKEVGRVYVPLKELYEAVSVTDDISCEVSKDEKYVVYQVQTSKGRFKGQLEFSYKFGEKFTQASERRANEPAVPFDPKIMNQKGDDNEPIMAYPAGPYPGPLPETSTPPSVGGSAPYNNNYGAPAPAPAPPPPSYPHHYQGYGQGQGQGQGYGHGYGYPPYQYQQPPNAQMGYGYGYSGGYGYPGPGQGQGQGQGSSGYVQAPPPPKGKKSKFGLGTAAGVGAGLLGGLLVGEMVEDVAEAAVYDDDDW